MTASPASRIFMSGAQQRALSNGVGIFMLHKTAPAPTGTIDPFDYIAPEQWQDRLTQLKDRFGRNASLDDWSARARATGFVITFDDGYRDTVTTAMPLLDELGVNAVMYVVADRIGKTNEWSVAKGDVEEPLADESLLREWTASGHTIGSHTLTHAHLRNIPVADAREEVLASRKKLEDLLGVEVRHFAYPYGAYNESVRDMVREAGYETAATVQFGVAQAGFAAYELPRTHMLTAWEWARKAAHRACRNWGR